MALHERVWVPHSSTPPVEVGEVVLMSDKYSNRSNWPFGVIQRVIKSPQDGLVRGVELRLSDGRVFKRPITAVYPTEVRQTPQLRQDAPSPELAIDFAH